MIKSLFCFIFGLIGSFFAIAFGGWSSGLTTLIIFLAADYITGLIVAGVFQNSTHTNNGGLESRTALKGIFRKFAIIFVVALSNRLDILLHCDYIMNACIIAFISSELISLVENLGLMGIPIPSAITKAISVLKEKEDELK
ncbi:MAG: phage holin family protein [Clostridia bacterium]|nr:phage holin family protein [Clostridia bacterium]